MIFSKTQIQNLIDKFIQVTPGENTEFGSILHIIFKLDEKYYRFSMEIPDGFIGATFKYLPDEVECQEVEPYQITTTHYRIKG